jgi:EmrB/QacA subfamily drug resistance transporter
MPASHAPGTPRRIAPRGLPTQSPGATLALVALAYLMVALDSTVVNVALPSIAFDLGFTPTGLAWVFNAYLLTFGGLLLLGGRTGDVFGRRLVFGAGVALFTGASLLAGLAPSAEWLVAARAIQGVGGAMITPNTLALLAASFGEGAARNRALAVYSAVAMSGASIGLIVGGVLTTWATWRWALFINVPIGIAIVALTPRAIRSTERRPGRLDIPGGVSSTLAMGAIVYGLIRAGSNGWDGATFLALAAGLILLAGFLVIERRESQPVLPLHLLRERTRLAAYATLFLIPGSVFGAFFFLTQFLQDVRGFGPLGAGLAFLPQTIATVSAVRVAPRLMTRFGPGRVLSLGGLLILAGVTWLTRITATSDYVTSLLVPLILIGMGAGWSFLPLNATILAGVGRDEAGAASGAAQAMQWVGGSFGLAVMTSVFGATTASIAGAASPADVFARGASAALTVGMVLAIGVIALAAGVIARRTARPATSPASTAQPETSGSL